MNTALITMTPLFPGTDRLVDIGVRIALTLIVAFLLRWLLFLLVRRAERWIVDASHGGHESEQRARTLGQTFRSLITVVVAGGAMIHVLELLGWDVKSLLVGAGLAGVALAFGAQTLVRDVIAGVFILIENQFGVGDVIDVNGHAASVERVTLRSTTLRDFNGYVHFVPNGEMKVVINRSRGWNRLAVDLSVARDQDLGRALEICRDAAAALNTDPQWEKRLLEPVELVGIESASGSEVVLRMLVRARPGGDAPEAARELRRRALLALTEDGIRAATREIVVLLPTPAAVPVNTLAAG